MPPYASEKCSEPPDYAAAMEVEDPRSAPRNRRTPLPAGLDEYEEG